MLESDNWIDEALLDWTIYKLQHRHYPNFQYLWERWVRS